MSKRYITTLPDGALGVISLNEDDPTGDELARTLFSLSRSADKTTRFDPAIHTLSNIASGISGHAPLEYHECDEDDLPADRYFRNAWEWSD